MNLRQLTWLLGVGAAIVAAPAWAEFKWTFNYSSSTNCLGDNGSAACNFGNTRNASSVSGSPAPLPPTTSVSAQAWSNTTGTGSGPLQTAYLPGWGSNGLGVQNRDMANLPGPTPTGLGDRGDAVEGSSPEHAVDNNQRFDAILFQFGGNGVKLSGVEIGYKNTDSDLFVLAYTSTNPLQLDGLNYSQLTSNGWSLVDNASNLSTNAKKDVNAGGVTANYWLIGTGCFSASSGVSTCDSYKDHVKLLALYGQAGGGNGKVPEPSSLLLLAAGMVGVWRVGQARRANR